jgi:hypothetical protein
MRYAAIVSSVVRIEFDPPDPGPQVVEEGFDDHQAAEVYDARVGAARYAEDTVVGAVSERLGSLGEVVESRVMEVVEVEEVGTS